MPAARPQSVRDSSIQKHFYYRQQIIDRNRSAYRLPKKSASIRSSTILQQQRTTINTSYNEPSIYRNSQPSLRQTEQKSQDLIQLDGLISEASQRYTVFQDLKQKKTFMDEVMDSTLLTANRQAVFHLNQIWKQFRYEIIEKDNYLSALQPISSIVAAFENATTILRKHLIGCQLEGISTFIEHQFKIFSLLIDKNIKSFKDQVIKDSKAKVDSLTEENIILKQLITRYENQLSEIRHDYLNTKDQISWNYQKLVEEKVQLLDEIQNLKFKMDEAKDSSRTATYFIELNDKLKALTTTITTCEETMVLIILENQSEQQHQQEASLKTIGKITIQQSSEKHQRNEYEQELQSFLRQINLISTNHPFLFYLNPQLVYYRQRVPQHLIKLQTQEIVISFLELQLDRIAAQWDNINKINIQSRSLSSLSFEEEIQDKRNMFLQSEQQNLSQYYQFTPFDFSQFVVEKLHSSYQPDEVAVQILSIAQEMSYQENQEPKRQLFTQLLGLNTISFDVDVQYVIFYFWSQLDCKRGNLNYDATVQSLKSQLFSLHNDSAFMKKLESLKQSNLLDFESKFQPFLKSIDQLIQVNPLVMDYVDMLIEQAIQKHDPFNLGYMSLGALQAIFNKEINPSYEIHFTLDKEDKIEYLKLIQDVRLLVQEIRNNRLEKVVDRVAFMSLIGNHLQNRKMMMLREVKHKIISIVQEQSTLQEKIKQIQSFIDIKAFTDQKVFQIIFGSKYILDLLNNKIPDIPINDLTNRVENLVEKVIQYRRKISAHLYYESLQTDGFKSTTKLTTKKSSSRRQTVANVSHRASLSNNQMRINKKV